MAGVAVFVASRLVPAGRPERRTGEALAAIGTAIVCGLAATALDFGGWNEFDWRAGTFALCGAAAVVGALRAFALARR